MEASRSAGCFFCVAVASGKWQVGSSQWLGGECRGLGVCWGEKMGVGYMVGGRFGGGGRGEGAVTDWIKMMVVCLGGDWKGGENVAD